MQVRKDHWERVWLGSHLGWGWSAVALLGQAAPQAYARVTGHREGHDFRFPFLSPAMGWNERVVMDKGEIYVSIVTITMVVASK